MNISQKGIDLIKKYEGCRLFAYKPVQGEKYWTIGWGHYGADVTQGMTITQEKADELLLSDLKTYEAHVRRICNYLDLNQNQFDALVSFTYNCGSGCLNQLTKSQTRTKEEIADHIEAYVKGAGGIVLAGLVKRRKEEKELFLTPVKENKMLTLDEAIYFLNQKGLLNKPEHWKYMAQNVKDLDHVFIKWANSLATRDIKDEA